MKFYSFYFYLFLLLNFSPSFQASACESVEDPSNFSDCKGKTTESKEVTCCLNSYKDSNGNLKECVDILKTDAFDEDKLEDAEDKIEKGEYWDDYTTSYEDVNLECTSTSQCESVEDPFDFSYCKGKSTEYSSETCCFAIIKDNDGEGEECVDIKKEDAADEEKLKDAVERIKKGEYWDDYYGKYEKFEIVCNYNNSKFLKGIYAAIFAIFLF